MGIGLTCTVPSTQRNVQAELAGPCLRAVTRKLEARGQGAAERREGVREGQLLARAEARVRARAVGKAAAPMDGVMSKAPRTSKAPTMWTAPAKLTSVEEATESYGHNALLTPAMLRRSEREMADALFCLIPAGDSAITDRLYAAIASGCLPVVLADQLQGAFPARAVYDSFWVRVPMRDFIRRPEHLLTLLRAMPQDEVARRQQRSAWILFGVGSCQ